MATKNGLKALIVDDEPDILELLQYNLVKEGFEVRTADNGKRALEVARAFQPNLILLDIMMPVMDGIELCKKMKNDIQYSHIPIILLTAKNSISYLTSIVRSND